MENITFAAMSSFKSIILSLTRYRSHAASLSTCQYRSKHPSTPLGTLHEGAGNPREHSPTGLILDLSLD
ncbi:hypothetical protein E2C01_000385 [Portunus trituberculatus]|uniref:Uncharacterized protein n=1 Tax=Portunus trituberculatus TaxID=210409 RepID=A0A5B7CEZ9_PORTR|nr:hypothetical protein [Portunus trituberculatus]